MSVQPASLFDQPPPACGLAVGEATLLPAPAGWPAAPDQAAYHGLPGAIVQKVAPHTEADPVGILAQLLVCCGALIGRGAHFQVEATNHHPNEFAILIGDSSKSRKGSSFDHVAKLLSEADPAFPARMSTGLSSGEGLIWQLRDPAGQDPGNPDKRLLVLEPEFASVLKAAAREISTLSPTLRSAWDGRPLAVLTRTAPARATGAHVSVIGHITHTELRRYATAIEIANGLLNRFLLFCVRRVRLLPEGGDPEPLKGSGLARYLGTVLQHARATGKVTLADDTRQLWWQTYPKLTTPADGLTGQLTARAEAHTIRLALLYTLLDGERKIGPEHLTAALALSDYAARSAAWAINNATGDPIAEQIQAALASSPDGLTRTQLRDLLNRNHPAERVEQALQALASTGRATRRHQPRTTGRPAEIWAAAPAPGR